MKELIKYFYKNYQIFAKVALSLVVIDAGVHIVLNVLQKDWVGTGVNILMFALYMVPALIGWGFIQYKGLSSLFLNLSQYSFVSGLDYEDFNLTKDKVNKVKSLFEMKVKEAGDVINPMKLARDIAIDHDLTPEEYMFCLHVAARALQIGKNGSGIIAENADSEALKAKLTALKAKLDSERNKRPDDKKSGDKYDFL
jgi:hypothetical protein